MVIVGIMFINPSRTQAEYEPNIHLGQLELHPSGAISEKFDTNVFLEPRGQESEDWITDYSVGMGGKMPLVASRPEDFVLKAAGQVDFINYLHNDKQNRIDYRGSGRLLCDFANDFGVEVYEDFIRTADPPNSELTQLSKRYRNESGVMIDYTREKVKIEGDFSVTTDGYLQPLNNLSRNDWSGVGRWFYQIYPKTSVFGEMEMGSIRYFKNTTNSNSQYWQPTVGVKGLILTKLTGSVKGGYKVQNYAESYAANFNAFVIYGDLRYDMSERTVMNLYGHRTDNESNYANNSHYTENIFGVNFDHMLMEKLHWTSQAFFGRNDYPTTTTEGDNTAKRKDVLWGAGTGLRYDMKKWLVATLNYDFKQRDSCFHNFSYNDQQVTGKIAASF